MKKQNKKQAEAKPSVANSSAIKSQNKKLKWFLLSGILLLTLVVYYPSLKNDWTNWDDRGYVLDNDLTKISVQILSPISSPHLK